MSQKALVDSAALKSVSTHLAIDKIILPYDLTLKKMGAMIKSSVLDLVSDLKQLEI